VFQAAEYEDGIDSNSIWSTGDWNCDGEFSSSDFVAAFQGGRYQANARSVTSQELDRNAIAAAFADFDALEGAELKVKKRQHTGVFLP